MEKPLPILIVSHGQPSDPLPAAREIAHLADKVASHLPGHTVASVTLAEDGALANRVRELGLRGLVYPLFMAGGWFTRVNLPERLRQAGAADWKVLSPFGIDPMVQALAVIIAREAGLATGGELLLAAHGSFRSPAPAEVAHSVARLIGAELGLARAEAAFIDQEPKLAEVSGFSDQAVCLPFFAARGGHVIDDLPRALDEAGFQGRILEPLGLDPRVPAVIAQSLRNSARRQDDQVLT